MARNREWSRRVWNLVTMHSECVEQIGIEEGFLVLDASGEAHAHRIRQAIRDQVRLIGLGISGLSSHPQLSLFPRLPAGTLYERHEEVYTPPIR